MKKVVMKYSDVFPDAMSLDFGEYGFGEDIHAALHDCDDVTLYLDTSETGGFEIWELISYCYIQKITLCIIVNNDTHEIYRKNF